MDISVLNWKLAVQLIREGIIWMVTQEKEVTCTFKQLESHVPTWGGGANC